VPRLPPPGLAAGGAVFAVSKPALALWFLAIDLMTQSKNKVTALELKRTLGVVYPPAWLI
jgi:hypothetical protein